MEKKTNFNAKFKEKYKNYFGRLKQNPANKNGKLGFMDKMQMLGKTFMLPIATLSFCGILLGIGSGIANINGVKVDDTHTGIPWLFSIFTFISDIGNIGFTFLPFTFAMAIPIGLAKENKGVACLAAFIAYATFTVMTASMINLLPDSLTHTVKNDNGVVIDGGYIGRATKTIIGVNTLDYGVLGGIFTGIIVWKIHEKFQYIKFPNGIAFWGGTRFVPLFSMLVFAGFAVVMVFVLPGINLGLILIGKGLIKTGWGAPIIFQLMVVFTRPAGLHHMVNSLVRFTEVGGVDPLTGTAGALNIFKEQFNAGGAANVQLTPMMASILSGGYMPIMMFGMPAVALAIYLKAAKQNRKMVASIIIPGIIATAVGGISEPIEFLFLFVSPLLYGIHALLTGLSYMIVGLVGVKIGFTDGNIIDFIVNGIIQTPGSQWWWILPIGFGFFATYLSIWYFYIKWRKIAVIGNDGTIVSENSLKLTDIEKARGYLKLLGGKTNIKELGNCFTRLRINLNSPIEITQEQVKDLGAVGLKIISPLSLQIVIGTNVESVKNDIRKVMKE